MGELNLNYVRSENDNFLFRIEKIEQNAMNPLRRETIYRNHCTCGYKSNERTRLMECPECGAKLLEECTSKSGYNTFARNFVNKLSFTKDSGYIKYLFHELSIDEENETRMTKRIVEVKLGYVKNIKGQDKFTPQLFINGEEQRWLKSNVEEYLPRSSYRDSTETKALDILEGMASERIYHNIAMFAWSIHNKYKYGRSFLDDFFYRIDGDLDTIRKCNVIYNRLPHDNEEYINIIKDDLKEYGGYTNSSNNRTFGVDAKISGYRLSDKFSNPTAEFMEKLKREMRIKEAFFARKAEFDNYTGDYYSSSLIDILIETDVDMDTLLELLAHAERQSYDVRTYGKMNDLRTTYVTLHKAGIPMDWKPKELEIYVSKIKSLRQLLNTLPSYKRSMYSDDNIQIADDSKIIKVAYDLGGYKMLDKLLFEGFMNFGGYRRAGLAALYHNNKAMPMMILGRNSSCVEHPYKIFTADSVIDGREECLEYIKEAINNTKDESKEGEEILCKTTN